MLQNSILDDLLYGCRKNDRKCQEALYRLASKKLFIVCRRYARSHAEAEGLLQEGFVLIFSRITQFDRQGSFEGWMHRVIVNTALSKYRRNKNRPQCCELNDLADRAFSVNNDESDAKHLLHLIGQLPDVYRLPFNLHAIEGYAHREVAAMLGISEIQSRTNTSRARAVLRRLLGHPSTLQVTLSA